MLSYTKLYFSIFTCMLCSEHIFQYIFPKNVLKFLEFIIPKKLFLYPGLSSVTWTTVYLKNVILSTSTRNFQL